MARHLTWCFKRTFALTTRFDTHLRPRLVAKTSNSVVHKAHSAASRTKQLGFNSEEEHRDLEMFVEDAKCGKGHAVKALMKLLCISELNATQAVESYPTFKRLQKKIIYENFRILRENCMFKSTIKDNKFLLIGTPEDVKAKIDLIKSLGIDINHAVPLFHLSVLALKTICSYSKIDASYLPARNKLFYFAEKFKCDMTRICQAVSYNPFILSMPPPKLMTITEYVLAAGMAPEHILSDLALFRYPLSGIKEKVEQAKALGIHPVKPWIMRCGDHTWHLARQRFSHRGALFNPNITREQLICEVFECDPNMAQCILKRGHKMTSMSFEKLHNNLRLIRSFGYTADELMMATLIVQRRTSTLEKIFEMWNEAGLPKGRLGLFSKSIEELRKIISVRAAELRKQRRK